MECKECYFLMHITRNIWTLDHVNRACQLGFDLFVDVVALHVISRPYSVLIESGNCSSLNNFNRAASELFALELTSA